MNLLEEAMKLNGFTKLNPMQKSALAKNPFQGNFVISSPTASGKTFVAELIMLDNLLKSNKKIVYTAPLKALAHEHYRRFKKLYSRKFNIKVTISTGDFDSPSNYLAKFDVIYTTYEKLDSLIRHNAFWLSQIGMLVVDEIHEIDSDRGATIELLITKLRFLNPEIRVICLSATIPNAEELAKWLDAKLVVSEYRAVPLKEGVYFNGKICYEDTEEKIEEKENPIYSLIFDTLNRKKQILIFANTRRSAEKIAEKISPITYEFLGSRERKFLERHSEEILNVLEQPTEQCKRLAEVVKKGSAFHHAGLLSKQRTKIEDWFREGKIKAIVATPTLALGVNLPSHTVVIHSLYRYAGGISEGISVREYKQMIGRAGRPKYDKEGRAIIIARNKNEVEYYFQKYIFAPLEDIHSRLSLEPVLRAHVLSLIANRFVYDYRTMEEFFAKSFFASQYGNLSALFAKIDDIIKLLEEFGFIRVGERFEATALGKRVSELYLDPISAHKIISALMQEPKKNEFAYLFMISNCEELAPYVYLSPKQETLLYAELMDVREEQFFDVEKELYDETILNKFALAKVFEDWINEVSEQEIMENYKIQPGILRSRLENADWLLYSAIELEKVMRSKRHRKMLNMLRMRMKYGVKAELLALVQLRQIGRVRARKLYKNGFRRIADLKKAPTESLAKIVGRKIAESIKNQLFPQKKFLKT
ncbi:MAG: hypothetical protein DRO04_00880 [Candidatus Iainarchaeum archaeon]|uniref:ATP-dependent DNA helicase Hel308 n=1 Tax=Candidatus Iainarchaeum sp. TaxID=3101447 RepID=A0A497JHR1_9ARCH|nr:MAG: hypothetical protein DRO04_00880 [Candidatus Diapherotrites archaeon]